MRWSWFWWLRPSCSSQFPAIEVRLYTRHGCHLCEDAWRLLDERRHDYGYTLNAVDVDSDPALAVLYGERVPVVTFNGKERFHGRIAPALLDRLLRGEAGLADR